MTATTRDIAPDLIPIRTSGWRMGLANLTGKEFGQWWKTKLWWVQTLIWVLILDGISTVSMLDPDLPAEELTRQGIQTFFLVGATAMGIGIVLTLQGSVVGEKDMGTAAWVMSKPASRPAFIVSKLIANFTGFLVTALLIPSALFLLATSLIAPEPIVLADFAIGVAVMALNVLFYVTLTLALGCMFKGRGPIAGIGIGLILFGQFFKGSLPESLVTATPWLLGEVAASFPMQEMPGFDRVTPLVAVAIGTVIFAFLGIWRFGREEF